MVYLVAVDRQLQHNGPQTILSIDRIEAIARLSAFLLSKGADLGISLFAEELSEEEVAHAGASSVTIREVARRLGVKHRFCDPDRIQARRLRLHTDDRRQESWLWYLGDYLYGETILLACRERHIDGVSRKMQARGVHTAVLPERWGSALRHGEVVEATETRREEGVACRTSPEADGRRT